MSKEDSNDSGIASLDAFLLSLNPFFDSFEGQIIVTDSAHDIAYLNNTQLRLLGLAAEEVLGKGFAEIFSQDSSLQHFNELLKKAVATKKSTTRTRIKDTANSIYDIVTLSPILNAEQTLLGVITMVNQTAIEKPLADQEMRRRNFYLNAMIDSIPFMIWLKDKYGRILATNVAYAETAGFPDSEALKGKTDFDLWPKYLAENYIEDDLKVLESGEPIMLAEKVKSKNGSIAWMETYKGPVMVDGEVIGTVGYARDISEQKELHSTINEKDLQFFSLLKSLPLSVIQYDTACRRTFVNPIGHNAKENAEVQNLIGKTPLEKWDSGIKNITAEEYQSKLMHVLFHGEPQTFEMHCNSKDGRDAVSMVNLLPEFDEHHQVTGALAIANDVTEISKYRDDLEFMAYHDALTSLPNRALLNQRLLLAAKEDIKFGLMFMDIDLFKTINDTLGHVVGDALLVEAANRISSSVRKNDVVARIGGDEFAILVTDLQNDADITMLAEKIADNLSLPFTIDGINFFVTASIGIACYPKDSEDVEDLMKYADTAMYDAKKQGRNNFQFYTPELTQEAMEHLAIATALRYAIPKNELFLLYQPKVDIATGEILGAEALLRWHGKVLGRIDPDNFIPIAEESGLIIEIGAWVLQAACKVAVQLNHQRQSPLNIAVNVSSREFEGNHFIEHLEDCLQETGCNPNWITLEITESLLLQDSGKALETLKKIDAMGIKLSIDDFGTGYSALAYLSKFPIKQVKIDRSFVMDIDSSENAASLVKAIIAMALSLNKELVAEGIETEAQAKLIKEHGCNQAQGYFYSKPVTFSRFLHLVAQQQKH